MGQDIEAPKKIPVNDYAPGAKALGHITNVTQEAVNAIGIKAAEEIESAALSMIDEATALADEMRAFASIVRDQAKHHADQVSRFGEQAAEMQATIRALRTKHEVPQIPAGPEWTPLPEFMQVPLKEAAE